MPSGERVGPTCPGCESFGRPSEWPHLEGGAGRARPAEKTRAGRAGASRTFVRVESPPRGPGLCGHPRPQPHSLPGDVFLVCGVRSRWAGGAEFRVRGASRGAGERQDVRQSRGRQGERLRGRQARSRASAAVRRRRARAPPSSPRAAARAPGASAGGLAGLAEAVRRSEPRGRSGGQAAGRGSRGVAGAPSCCPGQVHLCRRRCLAPALGGRGRATGPTRANSARGVGSAATRRERAAGRRSGFGVLPPASL